MVHYNDPCAMSLVGPASTGLGIPTRVASRRVNYAVRNPAAYRSLTDGILCESEAVRRRCARAGIAAHLLLVVPDGVDPEVWRHRGPFSLTPK